MTLNLETLKDIVATANIEGLIGNIENDFFDCKSQPYQLQDDPGKRELAKDASSFANSGGGYIFIGVKTVEKAEHFGDEVESIHQFLSNLVNITQYQDVIRAWVYPQIDGVEVQWIEHPSQSGKGVVVITIPPQSDTVKPFVITKTLEGKKQVETFFGYAQRKSDTNQPLSVIDLQKALRSGLHYENEIKDRLDGMETLLRDSVGNKTEVQKKSDAERIEQRIARTLQYEGLINNRNLSITAFPNQPTQLKTIFLSNEGSIRRTLENPPILRYAGWNLRTLDQAKIMHGEMIRVGNGNRIVIDLYRDATFIFAGQGDHRFLAWHDEEKQKINPVALTEIILEFAAFYKHVIEDCESQPETFTVRVDLRNMHKDGVKTGLAPYHVGSYGQIFDHDRKDAPDDSMTIEKTFLIADFDSKVIAYELVKEIYLRFGLEEDKIPYVKEENGLKFTDVAAIKGI